MQFPDNQWALILGGSSGFGLASATKLAAHGMHVAIVHRDRRGAMKRIQPCFDHIRSFGVQLMTFNADALVHDVRQEILQSLSERLAPSGKIGVVLHSIAFGNLKPLAQRPPKAGRSRMLERLATELGVAVPDVDRAVSAVFDEGCSELHTIRPPADYGVAHLDDEDFARTIYSMGTSLWSWAREIRDHELFAADARLLGLTSEGNTTAWRGYAAVAAAKVAMESLSRSMALELAPWGIRSNIIQAGITETPAAKLIPGFEHMKASALMRNPLGRLTKPEDVANVVYLLCTPEAAWINGALIHVDGGEHISGGAH